MVIVNSLTFSDFATGVGVMPMILWYLHPVIKFEGLVLISAERVYIHVALP
jgi:hypothetical protein